jgi:hypothetical protein
LLQGRAVTLLDLSENALTESGSLHLCATVTATAASLVTLDLHRNELGNKGIKGTWRVGTNRVTLETLNIAKDGFTAE